MSSLLNPHGYPQTIIQTFNQPLIPLAMSSAAIFFLITFFSLRTGYNQKQQAWLLSLCSSAILSISSVPFVTQFALSGWDVCTMDGDSPLSVAVVSTFLTFLTMDLIIGTKYYPKYIEISTGWIHHISYGIMLVWVLRSQYTRFFCLMLLLESPTFVLALGQIHKHLRRDYVFASLFFSTRIVFHTFITITSYKHFPNPLAWRIMFFPLCMHLFWFYGFIQQQIRLHKQRVSSKAESVTEATVTEAVSGDKIPPANTTTTKTPIKTNSALIRPSNTLTQRPMHRLTAATVIVPPEFAPPSRAQRAKNASKKVLNVAVENMKKSERISRLMDRLGMQEFGGFIEGIGNHVAAY